MHIFALNIPNMKTGVFILYILFNTFAIISEAQRKPFIIKGELVARDSYISNGTHGMNNKTVIAKLLKNGGDMGLLSPEGKLYLLLPDETNRDVYEKLKNDAAEYLQVTGRREKQKGKQAIVVEKVLIL